MISRIVLGLSLFALPQLATAQTESTPISTPAPVCDTGHEVVVEVTKISGGRTNFSVSSSTSAIVRSEDSARKACQQLKKTLKTGQLSPRLLKLSLESTFAGAKRSIVGELPTDPKLRAKAISGQWPAQFSNVVSGHYCCIEK